MSLRPEWELDVQGAEKDSADPWRMRGVLSH